MKTIFTIFLTLTLLNCAKKEKDNTSTNLVALFALNNSSKTTEAPSITSFSPSIDIVGATVTFTGKSIPTDSSKISVRFNGTVSTNVSSNGNTSFSATVPTGATSGSVVITIDGKTYTMSNNFTIVNSSSITLNSTYLVGDVTSTNSNVYFTVNIPSSGNYLISLISKTTGFSPDTTIGNLNSINGGTNFSATATTGIGAGASNVNNYTASGIYGFTIKAETTQNSQTGSFGIQVLNTVVPFGASCNNFSSTTRGYCEEFSSGSKYTSSNCFGSNYSTTTTCAQANSSGTVVGKCTISYVDTGSKTIYYYSNASKVWSSSTARTDCTTLSSKTIFE
ncbi:MAG: IPT/TIG domain-containing protein [Leptospiraceae bacterium]|nr:IPT/TIG domain-containing protein [Leptospiraceae bacterium]MBK9499560.1 IPT/TIG domain-containing protein [Leptospiraceae bacterium]MBP6740975.1 IPT/TIG domain-containing protein [Leptospiraceae bacterium]